MNDTGTLTLQRIFFKSTSECALLFCSFQQSHKIDPFGIREQLFVIVLYCILVGRCQYDPKSIDDTAHCIPGNLNDSKLK